MAEDVGGKPTASRPGKTDDAGIDPSPPEHAPSPLPGSSSSETESSAPEAPALAVLLFCLVAFLAIYVIHGRVRRGEVELRRLPEHRYEYRIDLNDATEMEIQSLPGIGPTLAERIVANRESVGPFETIDELDRVRGIGPKTVERLRRYLRTDENTPTEADPN